MSNIQISLDPETRELLRSLIALTPAEFEPADRTPTLEPWSREISGDSGHRVEAWLHPNGNLFWIPAGQLPYGYAGACPLFVGRPYEAEVTK